MAQSKFSLPYNAAYYPGDWVRPRVNPGDWTPIIDTTETFNGHRVADRQGVYNLYDAPIGVRLKIEEANKSEPVLKAEKEWEGKGQLEASAVWKEDGHYHMICNAGATFLSPPRTCYAVSKDAYKWTRAAVGQVEFQGSTYNNIIGNSPGGGILDDPKAPAEERFKVMAEEGYWFDPDKGEEVSAKEAEKRWAAGEYQGPAYKGPRVELRGRLVGWTSPDRLNWKRIEKPLGEFPSDGGGAPYYDPDTDTYFAYLRVHGLPPEGPIGIGTGLPEIGIVRRAIGFTKTKDFRHWPPAKLVLHPDAEDGLDTAFYGCTYFPYPGRNDLHGMFVEAYHHVTDHVDSHIAFSRDGLLWTRPEHRAIIPLGPTGSGEDCTVYPCESPLIELPDGYWGLAYSGMSALHNQAGEWPLPGQISWARWQPHRLCGLEAEAEGRFTIPTVQRRSTQLRLNYRCKSGGWIKLELLHAVPSWVHPDVDPAAGFTFEQSDRLTGDSLDQIVTWNGKSDISSVGDMVAIRVKMYKAKLFAYKT